jgi:serine/alanine adding enzyme
MLCSLESSWNQLLLNIPSSGRDLYFNEEFLKLYEGNGEAVCFIFEEGVNLFLFPFIKTKFSYKGTEFWDFESPYGYGGPITNSKDCNFINRAQLEFMKFMEANGFIAGLVKFHPLLNNQDLLAGCSTLTFNRHTVGIDLTQDMESIWNEQIHSKHRNSIRKAEKAGLSCVIDADYVEYEGFRELYNETMKKKNANDFYFFNDDYFESFKKKFLHNSFLGHVKIADKIISSAIFFYSEKYAHYHLAGSDIQHLSLNPNCFLLYKVAEYLKSLEIQIFHLGGGTDTSENNPLFRFKARFSNKRYEFYIGEIIFNSSLYNQICDDWRLSNPDKAVFYKDKLLKYRY